MPAPLEGIRVVDFTRYQNGPHATAMLADMGADVLKVEMPGNGDPGRQLGVGADGFCSYFEALNRGKRSMTLDLRAEGAIEVVHRLIQDADVLAENFRPGYLDSIGLGYDDLKQVNPQLIYATNSGFGPEGEWATRGSFDVVAQGMSGAMIALGGGPGERPITAPWGLADQTGSLLFRLRHRHRPLPGARSQHGVGHLQNGNRWVSQLRGRDADPPGALSSRPAGLPAQRLPAWLNPQAFGITLLLGHLQLVPGRRRQVVHHGRLLDPKSWPPLCEACISIARTCSTTNAQHRLCCAIHSSDRFPSTSTTRNGCARSRYLATQEQMTFQQRRDRSSRGRLALPPDRRPDPLRSGLRLRRGRQRQPLLAQRLPSATADAASSRTSGGSHRSQGRRHPGQLQRNQDPGAVLSPRLLPGSTTPTSFYSLTVLLSHFS